MKFKVRSQKSEVWCSKSGRGPKSVWSGLHDGDPHWSAVLLILIPYIIMYFSSLFGYIICMFVFVVWQINCPGLWVWNLTYVQCLTMKATIRRLKYVRSQQSEVWKLMSKVHNRSLMYGVWRNLKFDVRRLPENCPKSEVPRMSVQNLESKNQNLKSKVCPKSKNRVWNESLKFVSCLSLKPKFRV